MGDSMTMRRLEGGRKTRPTWLKDVTDVLLAAAALLALALITVL
jgi:hypothetical protein